LSLPATSDLFEKVRGWYLLVGVLNGFLGPYIRLFTPILVKIPRIQVRRSEPSNKYGRWVCRLQSGNKNWFIENLVGFTGVVV
jgi:hypothetical protein